MDDNNDDDIKTILTDDEFLNNNKNENCETAENIDKNQANNGKPVKNNASTEKTDKERINLFKEINEFIAEHGKTCFTNGQYIFGPFDGMCPQFNSDLIYIMTNENDTNKTFNDENDGKVTKSKEKCDTHDFPYENVDKNGKY